MGLDGLLVPSACVYPFGKDGNPHMRDRKNEIGCSFPLSSTKIITNVERKSRKETKRYRSLYTMCTRLQFFARMLNGERSQVIWLLLLFSCTIERPCVCVCDLLFDTKQVPFSILYPKLSIPYYIKERTPVDIVFLSAWWQVHYIYTQRHTCNCHLFSVSYFLLFYFRFPGGKITLNIQSCGGHGGRESNDTIFIR